MAMTLKQQAMAYIEAYEACATADIVRDKATQAAFEARNNVSSKGWGLAAAIGLQHTFVDQQDMSQLVAIARALLRA